MIQVRKLFYNYKPEDEGVYIQTIVGYRKTPWKYTTRVLLDDEEIKQKVYAVENVCVQHRYQLRIDLWVCVLDFQWYK